MCSQYHNMLYFEFTSRYIWTLANESHVDHVRIKKQVQPQRKYQDRCDSGTTNYPQAIFIKWNPL